MTETVMPVTGCPSCLAPAEPEEEDGLRKYVCTECGYEFGHVMAEAARDSDCQLGVPESIRRSAGPPITQQWQAGIPGHPGSLVLLPVPDVPRRGE